MKLSDLMKSQQNEYGFDDTEILASHRIIALDGKNNKVLFDTAKNKADYIEKYMSGKVIAIWASAKEKMDIGYSGSYFQPCTMLYLSHDSWLKSQN